MVCLGLELGAAGWQAQTKPRSYIALLFKEDHSIKMIGIVGRY